VILFSIQIRIF